MWFVGILVGIILGALLLHGVGGAAAGAFVGFIIALVLRSHAAGSAQRAQVARPVSHVPGPMDVAAGAVALDARLASVEERLRRVEAQLGGHAADPIAPAPTQDANAKIPPPPAAPESVPISASVQAAAPPLVRIDLPPVQRAPAPNRLWAWFTSGNVLTRIGVVVLFFGVGFLLKYFAHYFTLPIEVRLIGVALLGTGLIALGMKLQRRRPGYGLSLQGAGAGILYLTVFAAFRFFDVLPAIPAFALLAVVAALTIWLALRNDSQPLCALAIAGGFLAPFLVDARAGGPALLFGYFALLNGVIFAVAWGRAWRALNVLGFLFTFVLGLFWGNQYYNPAYFATVEPFLMLFFAFYVVIAILYARRVPLLMRAPVDALLVFGVPLVGFALHAGLVQDVRYGVAWSAFALAVVYGALFATMRKRPEPGLTLLSRAFLALAVIFATIAIPFAADSRWTSAWWALEAAAVYWIGCEQRQRLARIAALVLQVGAAVALMVGGLPEGGSWFLNASFLGTTLIALAAFTTSFLADRAGDRISASEHSLSPLIFGWGLLWWIGGGVAEIVRHLPRGDEGNAVLLFDTVSTLVALMLRGWLRWLRLPWFGFALLPLMAVIAGMQWQHAHTTLLAWGWLIWPVAWATHWFTLRAAEGEHNRIATSDGATSTRAGLLPIVHTLSAISLLTWTSWEASEWVGRSMPSGTTWVACAAAWPAIAYLGLAVRYAGSARWPYARYREAYATGAGTAAGALLLVWFLIANVVSPGSSVPLPYLPVANPLDVTLMAALAALWSWARRFGYFDERTRYGWLGACVFLLVNGIVFRTMHQWGDVPWRWSALFASKPLQAALTLAWTATALPLMVIACRRSIRPLWMAGAALLAIVVAKLFLLDLAALSGLSRVIAFMGVGALLLLIGYLAPLPPALASDRDA